MSMAAREPIGSYRRGYIPATHGAPLEYPVGHLRRLRDADRLGERRRRRVREGSPARRLHDRSRRGHPPLPRGLARGRERVLRALRRGAPPHRAGDRQAHRLAARAVALGLPAGLRAAPARVQGVDDPAQQVQQEVQHRADLQHRRQAARPDAPAHQPRLRPGGHRPAGALLQARPRALQGGRAPHRRQEGVGAHRVELLPRRRAVPEGQGPRRVGQPPQGRAGDRAEEADGRGQDPAGGSEALRSIGVKVVSVHPDVLVATSRVWQTNCTILRGGEEGFVVDSPVLPDELELLPAVLEQTRFPFSGLLATHGDWDHLLGRFAFPEASLGVAESTAARLAAEPGAAQRELRTFDDEWYVARPRPLGLGSVQELPVPGRLELGDAELELHPTGGHTADGMAVWAPAAGVLVCGDHLSPVEIPWLSAGGSRDAYLATLERLAPLVERATAVVPGHGAVLDAARAQAILREDLGYLRALPDAKLPLARRTAAQQAIHAENLGRL